MRLLNCTSCHDILLVTNEWRYCMCKRSASKYIKDTIAVEVIGCAKIMEINDHDYRRLISNSRGSLDCKLMVVDGLRIQRAELPI